MKITTDNLSAKVGKLVNPKTAKDISLPKLQIDDIGSFSKMEALEKIDLSGNWFQFFRQIEGLFDAPNLKDINFSGCPVCKVENYRYFVVSRCPNLEVLDGQPVTDVDREKADRYAKIQRGEAVDEEPEIKAKREEEERRKEQERKDALERDKLERARKLDELKRKEEEEKRKKEQDRLEFLKAKEASNSLFGATEEEEEQPTDAPFGGSEPKSPTTAAKAEPAKTSPQKPAEQKPAPAKPSTPETKPKAAPQPAPEAKKPASTAVPTAASKPKQESLFGETEQAQFVDNRSGIVIKTKFDAVDSDKSSAKQPASEPARKILSDEDLFGPSTKIQFSKNDDFNSLFSDNSSDILKTLEAKTTTKPKTQSSIKIEDDLFSFSSNSNTKKNTKFDDDDLFSLVDNKSKSQNQTSNTEFNIEDYIAKQMTSSSGGLFD
eukprot:CAMPEP_0168547966 /NCGR_PEP_ID=MMETSP0413-20121227/4313_1 /TAXON_ID=136452 /ORGANISM="Filamoeba nolandi, Strain NC-AS-23-1" /LENGTH=434 /DNA_ID=CAMNT_0008578245 /DNA_START=67 /DNA_END=1371 /DNA_ORIENTATION=-